MTFESGILDGLRAEVPDDGRPASEGYFLPGLAKQNPTSAIRRSKINAILSEAKVFYEADKSNPKFAQAIVGKRAADENWTRFGGRLIMQCRLEEPFEVDGGTKVRIGVVCGDRIAQFFVVSFSGDEITGFEIDEGIVPNLLSATEAGGANG